MNAYFKEEIDANLDEVRSRTFCDVKMHPSKGVFDRPSFRKGLMNHLMDKGWLFPHKKAMLTFQGRIHFSFLGIDNYIFLGKNVWLVP